MKRKAPDSGVSVDKRPRISSDDSEILEFEESEALIEQVDGDDTKFRTGCIYLFTNLINDKVYVGQTLHYKTRMKTHKDSGKNPKQYFSRAIRKYGWENFTKDILIDDVPEEDLDNLEINYIAFYDSFNREKGYNLTMGGGGTSGWKKTKEQMDVHIKAMTINHEVEGGGCIHFDKKRKKFKVYSTILNMKRVYIGQYFTLKKAFQALKLFNTKQIRLPADSTVRRPGTGTIWKRGKRFRAAHKGKNIGTFDTNDEAEQALKIHIENL